MMKYELTTEQKTIGSVTLYRIRALRDIPEHDVKKGDLGGWIASYDNLSQAGDAWVSDDALVYGNARVSGRACIFDRARVYGDARVYDRAWVSDDARVYDRAWVYGNARVYGDVRVYDSEMLCSRFGFESRDDVERWIRKESEYLEEREEESK